jgi:glycosyltransferase involved in cell wall biosynthesis
VAAYSRLLASALSHHVDVDVVIEGLPERHERPLQRNVRLIASSAWRRRATRVLYCMGNSQLHEHVYDLLRECRGAVLLHDVQLTGFFGMLAGRERPEDPLGRLVERVENVYGSRIPRAELRTAPLDWRRRAELGITLAAEIAPHATRIFVHSEAAAALARFEATLAGVEREVSVLPFGMPQAAPSPRGASRQPPLVVHMGAISEIKGIGALIEAFGLLGVGRLVLAGASDEAGLAHWASVARQLAPAADIDVTGPISQTCYDTILSQADLAVQLREASNGEASLAVADCLAAGIPTIVSRLGWMGELPQSAVRHVEPHAPPERLAAAMSELLTDGAVRTELSTGALEHARRNSFERVAEAYLSALELD